MGKQRKEFRQTLPTTQVYNYKDDGTIDIKSAMHDAQNLEWHALFLAEEEKVLKASVVGNEYYALIEHIIRIDENNNKLKPPIVERYIKAGVFSLRMDKKAIAKGHNFASYIWSEKENPPLYNCPLSILKAASPTDNANALKWRYACLNKHREIKVEKSSLFEIKNLPLGSIIELTFNNRNGGELFRYELVPAAYQFKTPFWYNEERHKYKKHKDLAQMDNYTIIRYGYGE